jgi:hypothetical protein
MVFSLENIQGQKLCDDINEVLKDELCLYMTITSPGKEAFLNIEEERNFDVKIVHKQEIENAKNSVSKDHNLSITIVQDNENAVSITFRYGLYFFDSWSIIRLYHRILEKHHKGTYDKADISYLQYSAWREHIISEEGNEENSEFWKDIMKNLQPFRTNMELNVAEAGKRKTELYKLSDKLIQLLQNGTIDKEILLL